MIFSGHLKTLSFGEICIFAQFGIKGVEHAIDEGAGIFGPEKFAQIYRFVDCDLGRDIMAVQKFIDRHPEDTSIYSGHPLYGPVFRATAEERIDLLHVLPRTFY
jgi:hypothetical protein